MMTRKSEVKLFRGKDTKFERLGGPPGQATIARLVGPDLSALMNGGLAHFDGCDISWTVLYDEFFVVLEGTFKLGVDSKILEAHEGDVIWIPANTPIRYMGDKAKVFYSLAPGDWRKRHGME